MKFVACQLRCVYFPGTTLTNQPGERYQRELLLADCLLHCAFGGRAVRVRGSKGVSCSAEYSNKDATKRWIISCIMSSGFK
jgi:hypothetical protein